LLCDKTDGDRVVLMMGNTVEGVFSGVNEDAVTQAVMP